VKRRNLVRQLRIIARSGDTEFRFVREGRRHEIWMIGGERVYIPRHRKITEHTARAILEEAREAVR